MRVQVIDVVTEAAPDSINEDFAAVGATWALVLDGAGRYPGESGGCIHPITWVVTHLAGHIEKGLESRHDESLPAIVRDAIYATMRDHGPTCDLSDPLSPGAAGAIIRHTGSHLEWLAVGDCAIVIEKADQEYDAIVDDRVDNLPDAPVTTADVRTYTPEFVRTVRNRPGGFWVLGAEPAAADNALAGRVPAADVQRALVCSDGLSRLTERYGWSWRDVFAKADAAGLRGVIDSVREAERNDSSPRRWRGKRHDDATGIFLRAR